MDFGALTNNLPALLEILTQVVGTFALVATLTPNSNDNAIADFLLKIINFVGGNFGTSANKTD